MGDTSSRLLKDGAEPPEERGRVVEAGDRFRRSS